MWGRSAPAGVGLGVEEEETGEGREGGHEVDRRCRRREAAGPISGEIVIGPEPGAPRVVNPFPRAMRMTRVVTVLVAVLCLSMTSSPTSISRPAGESVPCRRDDSKLACLPLQRSIADRARRGPSLPSPESPNHCRVKGPLLRVDCSRPEPRAGTRGF